MSTFPICPRCGVDHRTYIRARDQVWFICHEHRLRWRADYWCESWTDKPERGPLPLDWSTPRQGMVSLTPGKTLLVIRLELL